MPAKKKVSTAVNKKEEENLKFLVALSNDPVGTFESVASSRVNPYGGITNKPTTAELDNIAEGVTPCNLNAGCYSVADTIELCKKAYWNVSIFKQTIDMQAEFCNSKLHFSGDQKNSLKFFRWWAEKINIWNLGQQWFREWFRSSNVLTYEFEGQISDSELRKNTRANKSLAKVKIPLKYSLLNPSLIRVFDAPNFIDATYGWIFSQNQIDELRKSTKPEDKAILKELDLSKAGYGQEYVVKIDPRKVRAVFNGKQDYEPLAIPMYYPVLSAINLKLTFQKAEQVISRTVDKAVLLLSVAPTDDHWADEAQKIAQQTAELVSVPAVGRCLTVFQGSKGEWLIPDLNKVFGPEKYKIVNEDIANGLMNIFWGEEKLGNSIIKIKVFLERLKQAREAFINMWLKPEMRKIADQLGFENIPEPSFEDINLKDELEYLKIYNRLYELGMFTDTDVIHAYKTGEMPTVSELEENQRRFIKLKEEGLFVENINTGGQAGRPTGTKAPKKQSEPADPSNASEKKIPIENLKSGIERIAKLVHSVKETYKEKNNLKRIRGKHEGMAESIAEEIMLQESPDKWSESIARYMDNPFYESGSERKDEILEIKASLSEYNISTIGAIQLFDSQE